MHHPYDSQVSRPNDVLQFIRRLIHSRPARDSKQLFWIEGIRQFVRAHDAHFEFDTIVFNPLLLRSGLARKLVRRLCASGVRQVRITPEQFRRVSITPRASGIGAIVRQKWTPLRGASPGRGLGWLIVSRLRSPGNLGTILRTAEAVGMSGVIFLGDGADPFDPLVLRASMGGTFHLSIVRAYPDALRMWLDDNRFCCIGLSPCAPRLWTDLPGDRPLAIAVGEERRGLSDPLERLCKMHVRLPMTGRADSVNVSVAAGVMMFELMRRVEPGSRADCTLMP
jgi:TrmH family RNA methyltransferase